MSFPLPLLLKNPHIVFQYINDWLKDFDTSLEEPRFVKTFKDLRGN